MTATSEWMEGLDNASMIAAVPVRRKISVAGDGETRTGSVPASVIERGTTYAGM